MSGVTTERPWEELTLSEAEYRRAGTRYRNRRSLRAYLFIVPYLLPFLAFLVVPTVWSIWLSFNQGGILDTAKYVGLDNWRAISSDTELTGAIKNTALYVVEAILLVFTLALFLALLLNRYRKGSNFFKLALYVPLLAPAVLVGLIWQFLTNYDFGLVNLLLNALGLDRLNILGSGTLALLTIVLAEVWRGLGFWTLYFLASLQNIPEELQDAARVDGARGLQRFRRVTLPLLRPMLLFAVVIAIIANFQVFDTVYVLTQGGPHESTSTLVWFIWKKMFQFQETGQAYAAAVLLLGIILVLTAISFWLLGARQKRVT
ncbi:MAG: sugar ABC transporter permease [Acidobacteria bacterium]|nr:sugar ABC transporter permease [Acidobacteriota bacterium]